MGQTEREVLTLAQELAEVSRLVEADDIETTLSRFVARVLRTVPGCHHATITVHGHVGVETVSDPGHPELVVAADPNRTGGGPIVEALTYAEPRRVDDTLTDRRWPAFCARVTAAGYRSCLVLPLTTKYSPPAAFTLFSQEPSQFEESAYDLVLLLTLHAEAVFDNAQLFHRHRRLVEQLTIALGTRHVIGQAQGLLMHRFGCTADEAFMLLKSASQNKNVKLREVASTLVAAHEERDLAAAIAKFDLAPTPVRPRSHG